MKTVTYRGPEDPLDGTTHFQLDEPEHYVLPKGAPVRVSDEAAEALIAYPGHEFEVQSSGSAVKKTDKARQGANEKE